MQDDLTTVFRSLLTGKITLSRRIEELQATYRKLNRWDDV